MGRLPITGVLDHSNTALDGDDMTSTAKKTRPRVAPSVNDSVKLLSKLTNTTRHCFNAVSRINSEAGSLLTKGERKGLMELRKDLNMLFENQFEKQK